MKRTDEMLKEKSNILGMEFDRQKQDIANVKAGYSPDDDVIVIDPVEEYLGIEAGFYYGVNAIKNPFDLSFNGDGNSGSGKFFV